MVGRQRVGGMRSRGRGTRRDGGWREVEGNGGGDRGIGEGGEQGARGIGVKRKGVGRIEKEREAGRGGVVG